MTNQVVPDLATEHAVIAPPLDQQGLPLDAPSPALPVWRRNGFARVLVFALAAIAAMFLIGAIWGAVNGPEKWMTGVVQLVGTIIAYIVLLAFEGRLRNPLELSPRRLPGLVVGLILGATLVLIATGMITVLGFRTFTGTGTPTELALNLFTLGAVAGISEEIIFRGIIHRMVEQGFGTWIAAGLSGLFFGAAHITNPQATVWGAIAIALEAGVMLGLLYTLTRNLWLLIGLHAAWNIVQGPILGSVVSGTGAEGNGFLVSHPHGNELLSGGVFGIEASLITVIVMTLFTAVIAVMAQRRGLIVAPFWAQNRTSQLS